MSKSQDDQVEDARVGAGSFPRAIPEDSVEYTIFWLDQALSDVERRAKLRQIQAAANTLVKQHLKDYIWQQDPFALVLVKSDGIDHLRGRTSYGDSIEDEWIIVWLCVELSKQFKDAWIRISDADGEFLLIEAAKALPRWLNPEIADNRIWINQGHLHVIPQQQGEGGSKSQHSGSLTLIQAMNFLASEKSKLLSDKEIEREAFYRIKKYPDGIMDNFHHALVTIPRKLAFLLFKTPAYISPAIEAFYLRDPIALKPLQATSTSALRFPATDFVTCRTKFTKVGFAKVRSQQFPYPPSWSGGKEPTRDSTAAFHDEMGMKLTCGFEMLLADPHKKDKKVVREIELLLGDLKEGDETLPSNEDVQARGTTEDDDSWLDIDYRDFERELNNQGSSNGKEKGFGDANAHSKLQKMVSRFEELMAADTEEGLDLDDMDEDNDSDAGSPGSDTGSHNSAEEDFNAMMREMLGMDKETLDELMGITTDRKPDKGKAKAPSDSDDDAEDDLEYQEILKQSKAMEAELRASGALSLDSKDLTKKALRDQSDKVDDEEQHSSDEEHLDENYNLVKNMLQSFKSQAGQAGPAGNLMSMLGMQLPRDDHDHDSD